ncbi:hypothetical protein ANOM_006450 [Aspergillus nomiae NRRL 13137]|uniref:F-box domain-containing protein n=1 Tax=Aspergillus nomiae NRRL (strain ATCC 15546 / NRRL 13137 / CBS 260.88 / M93) TaxID=1509407 RepID=A0A0L1J0L0_ASPN3|nr:uncharacterized protein ANOM_006450 [Aspergillus nomiae NRRL 13137]KNG85304.1 hypothetical protein ANOM_006450 [Aspergillus nomiae NRRL 13137]
MPNTPRPVESDGSRVGIHRIGTTELLEQILLHLDMQTLLVSATRVCRAWNSLITASPPLQRALFLLPEDNHDPSDTNTIVNPLLAKHFPPFFTPVYDIGCPFPIQGLAPDEGCYDYLFEDVSYNGMKNFKSMPVYQLSMANDDFIDHDGQDPNANTKARENNPYLRECASWRNMLTSQPPARKLGYCMLSTGGNSTIASTKILSVKCRKDGDDQGGSIEVNSAANQNPPIRMANLMSDDAPYEEEINKLVAEHGAVPPPYVTFPDIHPFEIFWRMGSGESYLMIYSAWSAKEGMSEAQWIEYFRKFPPPLIWLTWVIDCIWNVAEKVEENIGENSDDDEFTLDPLEFDYWCYFRRTAALGFGTESDCVWSGTAPIGPLLFASTGLGVPASDSLSGLWYIYAVVTLITGVVLVAGVRVVEAPPSCSGADTREICY